MVVVGDSQVGKTTLLMSFGSSSSFLPTLLDDFRVDLEVDGSIRSIQVSDTPGFSDYDRIRPFVLQNASALLLCFSMSSWISFQRAETFLYPQIRSCCPKAAMILVGTKLKSGDSAIQVSTDQATRFAQRIGAIYRQVDIGDRRAVEQLFRLAVTEADKKNNILNSQGTAFPFCTVL